MSEIDSVDVDSMDVSESTKTLLRAAQAWNASNDGSLIVYAEGLCFASVCTSLNDEEADARMAARPATATRGWARSAEPTFEGGLPNPCPCEENPQTHRHILYEA